MVVATCLDDVSFGTHTEALKAPHLSYVGTPSDIFNEDILLDASIIWGVASSDVHLGIHNWELQDTLSTLRTLDQ